LVPIARELGTTIDALVESESDEDVVIRPVRDHLRGSTTWLLTRNRAPHGATVAKIRITAPRQPLPADQLRVHPGRAWFTVLSGTARLQLGERIVLVETGQAAEFSAMVPHAIGPHGGPVEIVAILEQDSERPHLTGGPS
jgi:mannose-6-phosphate isomerase-like protein (cupin superfamily)